MRIPTTQTTLRDSRIIDVDELIDQYNKEFDLQKRIALIREMDGILTNDYQYVLQWYRPSQRLAYWNSYGQPKGTLTRIGDYSSDMSCWGRAWSSSGGSILRNLRNWRRRSRILQSNSRRRRLKTTTGRSYAKDGSAESKMTGYFIRRFLLIIPTFLGITVAAFCRHAIGSRRARRTPDPALQDVADGRRRRRRRGARGVEIPAEAIEEMKRYYGFDKPIHVRYAKWLWNVLHLDLGRSYIYQDPVWDVIKSRFPFQFSWD